jgi:hypothetical protein
MDRNLLEAMIQQLDGYKGELQAIRVYEEINYVVPILGRLVESLQAEA